MENSQNKRTLQLDDRYVTNIQTAGNYTYIGKALCGSATSDAVWQIKRIDATTGTIIQWADGDQDFDNVFDNRATTVVYS
mgnify:CR=1 FL=1